ncbi:hypothetical protein PC117_g19060 [Phytophthora cactorum]|uniref:Uncharacterized protein n=1 Tax=Phytophthora cactorum TaxID=29920 RepID=A0A8T1C1G2_9STRA|nr:hypothetical protein PC117_g19060 [Phytophthora cactorum]
MTTAVVSSSITMLTMVDHSFVTLAKAMDYRLGRSMGTSDRIPVRNIWNSTGNLLECFSIRLHLNCINCVIPADANAASTAPVIVL